MRSVSNILDSKPLPFNVIGPNEKVIDALQMMNSVNLSYLIVKDGDEFQGIFSERDYSRNVILKGLHSNICTVKEVMSLSLPIVGLDDSVELCMHMLNIHKTRYLLVFDDDVFKGVVTLNDVLREAIASTDTIFNESDVKNVTEMQDKIY